MTGVGHVQVDHLHPPSTDSLTGQGHVTVCINSRTISRLKPIVARWRIGIIAENLSTRVKHLPQFSGFAYILEDRHKINTVTVKFNKINVTYHRYSSHSLELPVVRL